MIDLSTAVKAAEELDKAVGVLSKLVGKLKAQPNLAGQKLSQALGEVAKTLSVVDKTASEFLSLGIDEGALGKNSKLLLEIDGGSLMTEVRLGRGHCHTIYQIFQKYLTRWFQDVFNNDEFTAIQTVFEQLGNADSNLFNDLEQTALILQREAAVVLDFVIKGDEANARKEVLSTIEPLRPLRRTMASTMQTLYSMQEEFVEITRAV